MQLKIESGSSSNDQKNNNLRIKVLSLFLIALIPLLLIQYSTIGHKSLGQEYKNSDPMGTLLLSQQILHHGTIKLDNAHPELVQAMGYRVHKKNDHFYYYFPIGTSFFAVPFLWVIEKFIPEVGGIYLIKHEKFIQKIILMFTTFFTLIVFYLLSRIFITHWKSLLLVGTFWAGTSFSSTLGTALWSHNFAVLLSALSLYGLLHLQLKIKANHIGRFKNISWAIAVGIFIFCAYLTRPTYAIFAVLSVIYAFVFIDKKTWVIISATSFTLFLCFVAFSFNEFGQYLPDYYLPKRLTGDSFFTPLYGNLFSPQRGLFIYSPFLLWSIFVAFKRINHSHKIEINNNNYAERLSLQGNKTLLYFCASWSLLHLISISNFPHWWAGWSYGPRLMSDCLPAFFIIYIIAMRSVIVTKNFQFIILVLLILSSVYINVFQGLYNRDSYEWNARFLGGNETEEAILSWQYPQFLYRNSSSE